MKGFTLTIVFSERLDEVLLLFNRKLDAWNFPGGKVYAGEDIIEASLRELKEETGIVPDRLFKVRKEQVTYFYTDSNSDLHDGRLTRNMLVTACVVPQQEFYRDIPNSKRVRINSDELIHGTYGNGSCFTYTIEALKIINSQRQEKER